MFQDKKVEPESHYQIRLSETHAQAHQDHNLEPHPEINLLSLLLKYRTGWGRNTTGNRDSVEEFRKEKKNQQYLENCAHRRSNDGEFSLNLGQISALRFLVL